MSSSMSLQIARDGHFGNREGQFAVLDPQPGGAARVVAGDGVDAEAHQFGDVEAVADRRDDLLRRLVARSEKKLPWPMPALPVMPREALPVVFRPSLRAV